MAITQISICNLALSWLGGTLITSFEDDSTEAKLCSANYDSSRDATLEDRNWTFASGRNKPPLLADPPEFGFSSAFQLPTNPLCIRVTKVSDSADFSTIINSWEKEGDQLLCDFTVIYLKYIKQITDPTKFSPGFVQTLAARIAADICVPLTNDVELFTTYWQLYLNKLETAGANDGLQSKADKLTAVQLIGVR